LNADLRIACLALLASLASTACTRATADTPAGPCGGKDYAQLDFWVGNWTVTNAGKVAGTNRIEKVLGGCALLESWQSVGQHRGHSLTFYDAPRDLWHQTWIDVAGQPLYLEGRLVDGGMQLEGTRPDPKGGPAVRHRIVWTPLKQGGLRQHWRSSSDGGRTWTDLFDGYYAVTR
jgi:hypothetical protein